MQDHHWFLKYHSTPGKGQAAVNAKCPNSGIKIDDYTTPYAARILPAPPGSPVAPHHDVHKQRYNSIYEALLRDSPDCCTFLIGIQMLMKAENDRLASNNTRGLQGGMPFLGPWNAKGGGGQTNRKLALKTISACLSEVTEGKAAAALSILRKAIEQERQKIKAKTPPPPARIPPQSVPPGRGGSRMGPPATGPLPPHIRRGMLDDLKRYGNPIGLPWNPWRDYDDMDDEKLEREWREIRRPTIQLQPHMVPQGTGVEPLSTMPSPNARRQAQPPSVPMQRALK